MVRSNAANALTSARAVAALAVILLVTQPRVALWIFLGAFVTDLLDGPLARRLDTTSALGAQWDQSADKLLAAAAMITIGIIQWLSLIWVMLLALAAAIVAVARSQIAARKRSIAIATLVLVVAVYWLAVASLASRGYGWHTYYLGVAATSTVLVAVAYRDRVRSWRAGELF